MSETEEEEEYAKRNFNNVTMDTLTSHNQYTKEIWKREKWETNCFGNSCRSDKIIQGIYDPINN